MMKGVRGEILSAPRKHFDARFMPLSEGLRCVG